MNHRVANRDRFLRAAAAAASLLLCMGLAAGGETPQRIGVVASIFPLKSIAEEVGGERVSVHALVPPGASPHAFEATPGDLVRLARAELFIRVGGGLEEWAERLLVARDGEIRTLTLLQHGESRPHIWLDPLIVRDDIVPAIARALAEIDPGGAASYRQRAARLQSRLADLDAEIRAVLSRARGRRFVAFHAAWEHFAERYGLEQLAAIEESAGEQPTPRALARLVDLAREHAVPAILIEPQLRGRIAEVIAAEFGGTTVVVDPLGDPEDPERSAYDNLMRYNARAFKRALGGGKKSLSGGRSIKE